jgi:hypothetical protein
MIIINGMELNENLQLTGVHSQSEVAQSITYTFGKPVVQYIDYAKGKKFILLSEQSSDAVYGYFTYAQAEYLEMIRDNVIPVLLEHPKFTGTVMIPQNGISFVELFDENEVCGDTIFTGSVELVTL